MGEIAEMMLDGILDANGEHTGHDYGYPVYPKGWFGKKEFKSSWPDVCKVRTFMGARGIKKGEPQKKMLKAYGKSIGVDRPTHHACKNWTQFKKFVDSQIGYVKPSKLK